MIRDILAHEYDAEIIPHKIKERRDYLNHRRSATYIVDLVGLVSTHAQIVLNDKPTMAQNYTTFCNWAISDARLNPCKLS